MPNDLDDLMSRIEEINAKDPPLPAEDITALIAYHRRSRELKASGVKATPKQKADVKDILAKIIKKPNAPAQKINRRV